VVHNSSNEENYIEDISLSKRLKMELKINLGTTIWSKIIFNNVLNVSHNFLYLTCSIKTTGKIICDNLIRTKYMNIYGQKIILR